MPHQAHFQYDLHRSRFSNISKAEKFWSEKYIGHLFCHANDVYEDLGGEESTYVYAIQFSPFKGQENLLAVANEEGRLTIQDTDKSGEDSILVGFEAHNNAIFDVSWMPGANSGYVAMSSSIYAMVLVLGQFKVNFGSVFSQFSDNSVSILDQY